MIRKAINESCDTGSTVPINSEKFPEIEKGVSEVKRMFYKDYFALVFDFRFCTFSLAGITPVHFIVVCAKSKKSSFNHSLITKNKSTYLTGTVGKIFCE